MSDRSISRSRYTNRRSFRGRNNYDRGILWFLIWKCAVANEMWSIFSCDETNIRAPRDVVAREDIGRFFFIFLENVPFTFRDPRFEITARLREHFHAWVTFVILVIPSPWLHSWEPAGRALVSRDSVVSWRSASFLEVSTPSISVATHSIASLIKSSRCSDRVVPICPSCCSKARLNSTWKSFPSMLHVLIFNRHVSFEQVHCPIYAKFLFFLSRRFFTGIFLTRKSLKYSGWKVNARIVLKLDYLFGSRNQNPFDKTLRELEWSTYKRTTLKNFSGANIWNKSLIIYPVYAKSNFTW